MRRSGSRLVLLIMLAAVTEAFVLAQKSPPANVNSEYIKHLEIPAYPLLGLQARIQATETVSVLVGDQGSPGPIHVVASRAKIAKDVFTRAIQAAINNSSFVPTCAGRAVRLTFHFRLAEDGPLGTSFQFDPPNDFWITSTPTHFNPAH